MSTIYNFGALYAHYPAVIRLMPDDFTSHGFIQRLAQQHQNLYIAALNAYAGRHDPFKIVHGVLAQRLHAHPDMIEHRGYISSQDIFGQPNGCTSWHKIAP